MKKYIMPSVEVINVETQQMLAVSLSLSEDVVDPSNAEARAFEGLEEIIMFDNQF